jgi:hypothetical protein
MRSVMLHPKFRREMSTSGSPASRFRCFLLGRYCSSSETPLMACRNRSGVTRRRMAASSKSPRAAHNANFISYRDSAQFSGRFVNGYFESDTM